MATPEEQARQQIDAQLAAAGWLVQDRAALNLAAGPGVAVREFPLAGGIHSDYMLFANRKAVGVVEAKPEGTTLLGVADQSGAYLTALPPNIPHFEVVAGARRGDVNSSESESPAVPLQTDGSLPEGGARWEAFPPGGAQRENWNAMESESPAVPLQIPAVPRTRGCMIAGGGDSPNGHGGEVEGDRGRRIRDGARRGGVSSVGARRDG